MSVDCDRTTKTRRRKQFSGSISFHTFSLKANEDSNIFTHRYVSLFVMKLAFKAVLNFE